MNLPKDVAALAGIFAVSGVIHLAKPEVYEPLMPSWVPRHREVILGSGVAELACALSDYGASLRSSAVAAGEPVLRPSQKRATARRKAT